MIFSRPSFGWERSRRSSVGGFGKREMPFHFPTSASKFKRAHNKLFRNGSVLARRRELCLRETVPAFPRIFQLSQISIIKERREEGWREEFKFAIALSVGH